MSAERLRWTDRQLQAIRTVDRNVLVSAAAGSGKTSVLAERCVYLLCDAPRRCSAHELLVVTFGEEAAAEMRSRIEQALRKRAAAGDDPHIRRQAALIEHAEISTLHSFCNRLLRRHFHRLGLDPSSRILDGDEARLIQAQVARELFDEQYDRPQPEPFLELIDAYGNGRDRELIQRVVAAHRTLCSVVDPDAWRAQALLRIEQAASLPLEQSPLGRDYLAAVAEDLDDLARTCRRSADAIAALGDFAGYVGVLRDLASQVESWKEALATAGYDRCAQLAKAFQKGRAPTVRSNVPNREAARALFDSARTLVQQLAEQGMVFTSEELRDGLRRIAPHARELLWLVGEFGRRYRARKDQLRAWDYADLERYALRLLQGEPTPSSPSPVALACRRQYAHVLVDEYQDINEVQDAILTLISRDGPAGSPEAGNLFCVGDVKQSIYRFRLAEPSRFLARQQRLRPGGPAGSVVDLPDNFRSRKPLLDCLNALFQRLMTRAAVDIEYDDTHRFNALAKYPSSDAPGCFAGGPIELHLLPDRMPDQAPQPDSDESSDLDADRTVRQATLTARLIRRLLGHDGSPRRTIAQRVGDDLVLRPIEHRDIVILLRTVAFQAQQYAQVLADWNLPVHNDSGGGFLDAVEIRDMLCLLSLLDNRRQDLPMAAVLRNPVFGLPRPEDALARIRLACRDAPDAPPLHLAVSRYASEHDDDLAHRLRAILAALDDWRIVAQRRPVADLIWSIYQSTGFLTFCAALADGRQRQANLIHLYDRARQYSAFARHGLAGFLEFLASLGEEADIAQASPVTAAGDAVRIMSIHRAKGLEFPVVFVPDIGKRINLADCQGDILLDRQAGLGLAVADPQRRVRYPSLASQLVERRIRQQTLAEEMRVLYVAMTRAREHLVLVGSCSEARLQGWMQTWASHRAPLPRDAILSASTMLDWIGPAAATLEDPAATIRIERYTADDVRSWTPPAPPAEDAAWRRDLADFKPLSPPPPEPPPAQDLIRRLSWTYPHDAFTKIQAAVSVTSLAKPPPAPSAAAPRDASSLARLLPDPAFRTARALSAADRGTATHLFLEKLDFSRPCTRGDLLAQVESLVAMKLATRQQAQAIDLETVLWFLSTPVGRQMRRHAAALLREVPFYLAIPPMLPAPDSDDPLDRVMLRGRIDALVPDDDGYAIVDYKTDNVSGPGVAARIQQYRPQVLHYCQAVERITGRPVRAAHLVFLTPRAIHTEPGGQTPPPLTPGH